MIKRTLACMSLAFLAGCSQFQTEGERAEARYNLVQQSPLANSSGELCAAARDARAAYLKSGDAEKYKVWDMAVYADCFNAAA